MFQLRSLALQATHLDGDFLEVGVWKGGSSAIIQSACVDAHFSPRFYSADTFQGVVKANQQKDTHYKGGEFSDAGLCHIDALYDKLDMEKPEVWVGVFPEDHPDFTIEKLVFVHCDVDTCKFVKDVITWCLPRLVPGH